ncbi:MAG: response regulator, partial [Chloroflexi bacterium]
MLCHRAREVVGTSVNGDRPEILVVDDDRDLVDLLAFLIEQAGLASLVAYDPAGALEVFDKERPAVAIIDLNLDPWDGFELVGQLRQR